MTLFNVSSDVLNCLIILSYASLGIQVFKRGSENISGKTNHGEFNLKWSFRKYHLMKLFLVISLISLVFHADRPG